MKSENRHLIASVFLMLLCACFQLGFCRDDPFIRTETLTLSGIFNWAEIQSIGRFAVQEHNNKANDLLEFASVVRATEQVVAGKIYHLTLEAIDSGKKKLFDAKVWVKPWMNFKQLQEFRIKDTPLFSSPDLALEGESHEPEWSEVSSFDPVVKDAAVHAVKSIQNRSNCLLPYKLIEVLKAKAKVIRDSTVFTLLLKVRRGSKDEKFKVVVKKSIGGVFWLNQMEPDFS